MGKQIVERRLVNKNGLNRPLLKDRAYDALKEMILTDVLQPGTFLSERKVSEELGMSKTPIREAISRLEMEGYVRVSPQQGVVIRELTAQEIVGLFDMRIALETFVVRRIAGKLTAVQKDDLRANIEAQEPFVEAEDPKEFTILDADFHVLLCECLDNQEIVKTMRQVKDRLFRMAFHVVKYSEDRFVDSLAEHREVAEAVIAGKGATAAKVVEKHLEMGKRFLLNV